jgi:hypothetical protein
MSTLLFMYTVYRFPSDYPDKWVVRRWAVYAGGPVPGQAVVFDTLERARTSLPPGLCRLERSPRDEPQIYEVWL